MTRSSLACFRVNIFRRHQLRRSIHDLFDASPNLEVPGSIGFGLRIIL